MRTLQYNQYSQGPNSLRAARSRPAALCGHPRYQVCERLGLSECGHADRRDQAKYGLRTPERYHFVFCLL
ncbi:hypothetical protein R69888_04784 [Paraburkholderia haematera]|uniref:Uncharacterized protein n=1 Tax=Paraburkholderia haematera TaxID=2793077 RepID=A0ABM8S6L6_9BURK|nr:hypothetical protein R69888_04784 [Paraburkholderia haematera]